MVLSTSDNSFYYPASSVLILAEEDAWMDNGQENYWLAETGKTTGQGFTLKVDTCTRLIAGCQIKNLGKGVQTGRATKEFRVSGSIDENGPWEILVEDQLIDTSSGQPASLLNFTFEEPVEIQFIKFDLVNYWGYGGALQYFAAILATSKASTKTAIMNLELILLFLQSSATSQNGQNGLAAANLREGEGELQSVITSVRWWVSSRDALKTIAQKVITEVSFSSLFKFSSLLKYQFIARST